MENTRQLTETEQALLQAVFDHFNDTGEWPKSVEINVKFRKSGNLWKTSEKLGHTIINPGQRHDKKSQTCLTVKGIFLCQNSEEILDIFIKALRLCVSRFIETPSNPIISGSEIFTELQLEHENLKKVFWLLRGERNIWNSINDDKDPILFKMTLYDRIMEFEETITIEEYIRIAYPVEELSIDWRNTMEDGRFPVKYPVRLIFIKEDRLTELRVIQYKVLHPLNGEGYSIEYLKPPIPPDGLGAVVSHTLAAITANNLMGEAAILTEHEKIILAVRAHDKNEFYKLSRKLGGHPGEFVVTTENYEKLIDRTEDSRIVKQAILRALYSFFNYDSQAFLDAFSMYCSLPYQISTIKRSVALLKDIGDIQRKEPPTDSILGLEYRLNPKIYKELERKFSMTDRRIDTRNQGMINTQVRYDFFICHATEDKTPFVEEMAQALIEEKFKVWYDDFSLKWGDKLRRSIERGLSSSRYGIVVLSKNFFQKEWPQKELDALFALEGSSTRILPVWLNIAKEEVHKYAPLLADRMAVKSEDGIPRIILEAKKLQM